MKRRTLSLTAGVVGTLAGIVAPLDLAADWSGGISDVSRAVRIRPGVLLVKPNPGLSEEKVGEELRAFGGRAMRRLRGTGVEVIEVPAGSEVEVANRLRKNRRFAFAEPDMLVDPIAVVNDPSFGNQWHLQTMNVPAAWNHANGRGVTVAVCDTGVNANHPDLVGQVVPGWNTSSNSDDTSDVNGHGTLVSGVVAAAANNAVGGASVAPGARVMAMRVTDRTDGSAYLSDLAACVTWAADHGARVANLSYSGVPGSLSVGSAASYMMSKGGVVVAAAGNDGADMKYDNSPYIFTAAATDSADNRASYSNFGNYVDIAAPGSGIYTTNRNGGYSAVSGTSFASPDAAGTVALVMSANPGLTPTDVLSVIANTAKDRGTAGWDPYYGFGRVDAGAAVALAVDAVTSDRTPPAVAVLNPLGGTTVVDQVTVEVQATDDFGVTSVELLANGVVVASDTQEDPKSPYAYRFSWNSKSVSDGTHRLSARAKDAAGNVGSAREVSVTVKNAVDTTPPTISSLQPASGATVSGSATLSATATDNVAVASLVVSANGFQCTGKTNVSCTWNLTGVAAGWYTVTATATDTSGYSSTRTARVYVSVPTATPIKPKDSPRRMKTFWSWWR
jgi:hypothetical protein